ncbi:MAG: serine/threonine-protein kinase, partial [Chloroflexota bacterium]
MEIIGSRYKIIDTLGEGGMGVVYRAVDRLTGKPVALKQVKYNAGALAVTAAFDMSPAALRASLAREFQALAGLHHPHVIDVMDYGFDTQNHPFFTMTLLEKPRPLTDAGTGNSKAFKVRLLVEMLQALDYLHRRRMLHRDLKPDNALVSEANRVQVLDFGLAVLQEQIDPSDPSVSGTLAYIAPEILQGGSPSPQADLYAV